MKGHIQRQRTSRNLEDDYCITIGRCMQTIIINIFKRMGAVSPTPLLFTGRVYLLKNLEYQSENLDDENSY